MTSELDSESLSTLRKIIFKRDSCKLLVDVISDVQRDERLPFFNFRKFQKFSTSLKKIQKVSESLRKFQKVSESFRKFQKVQT